MKLYRFNQIKPGFPAYELQEQKVFNFIYLKKFISWEPVLDQHGETIWVKEPIKEIGIEILRKLKALDDERVKFFESN